MRVNVVSVLLALALVTSGVALGVPTNAVQDDETTTAAAEGQNVELGDDIVTTERGGSVTIPVSFDGTDTATVKIGSEDAVNYAIVVTVEDGNDDGQVNLTFDTDAAGESNATKVTTDAADDGATVESEIEHLGDEPPHPALAPGTYPITLYEGTSTDGEPVGKNNMVISEAATTEESATATTATETTTDETTGTETVETTVGTGGSVPGFGPLLALVALGAAAMLAARR